MHRGFVLEARFTSTTHLVSVSLALFLFAVSPSVSIALPLRLSPGVYHVAVASVVQTGASLTQATLLHEGSMPEGWEEWQVLLRWVLDGVVAELRIIRGTARLESAVVTRESARQNFHLRDAMIKFEDEGHRYILWPGTTLATVFPISVSGLWGRYFEAFDAEGVIGKYYEKWAQNPESAYYGMIWQGCGDGATHAQIKESIRNGWLQKGELASAEGTRMHRNIELALGGELHDGSACDVCMFYKYVTDWLEPRNWRVFRLEWSIYCTEAMVAGQIDAVFECCGEYHMVDWKRCAKVLDPAAGEFFGRKGKDPFEDCLDNSCSHYFVQQNLYAVILERRYGMKLSSMHLVQIHPKYQESMVIEVPDMRDRAGRILDDYAATRPRCLPWELV